MLAFGVSYDFSKYAMNFHELITFKKLSIGTYPTFKKLNIGTVPTFKKFYVGSLKKYFFIM